MSGITPEELEALPTAYRHALLAIMVSPPHQESPRRYLDTLQADHPPVLRIRLIAIALDVALLETFEIIHSVVSLALRPLLEARPAVELQRPGAIQQVEWDMLPQPLRLALVFHLCTDPCPTIPTNTWYDRAFWISERILAGVAHLAALKDCLYRPTDIRRFIWDEMYKVHGKRKYQQRRYQARKARTLAPAGMNLPPKLQEALHLALDLREDAHSSGRQPGLDSKSSTQPQDFGDSDQEALEEPLERFHQMVPYLLRFGSRVFQVLQELVDGSRTSSIYCSADLSDYRFQEALDALAFEGRRRKLLAKYEKAQQKALRRQAQGDSTHEALKHAYEAFKTTGGEDFERFQQHKANVDKVTAVLVWQLALLSHYPRSRLPEELHAALQAHLRSAYAVEGCVFDAMQALAATRGTSYLLPPGLRGIYRQHFFSKTGFGYHFEGYRGLPLDVFWAHYLRESTQLPADQTFEFVDRLSAAVSIRQNRLLWAEEELRGAAPDHPLHAIAREAVARWFAQALLLVCSRSRLHPKDSDEWRALAEVVHQLNAAARDLRGESSN